MSTTTGTELVQTKVAIQLKNGIAYEIELAREAWAEHDREVARALGHEYRRTDLEPIANYVLGDRPSVLEMPWDYHPSISVGAMAARPSPLGRGMDSYGVMSIPFWIEVLVPSDHFPSDDEVEKLYQQGLVDRRCKRTADAVVSCLNRDLTIGGINSNVDLALSVDQTPPFAIRGKEVDQHGQSCIFSLARIDAQVENYVALPGVETVSTLLPQGGMRLDT